MNATTVVRIIAIGVGATLAIDLWSMLLRGVFAVRSLDYCLLGRWILHMFTGTFTHESIATAARRRHECTVGWTAHYSIGATFALLFVWMAGTGWLAQPTLVPALSFGLVTTLVPFLLLQPALGLGVASSKTAHPNRARLKSIATHTVFGIGLWAVALLV